MEQPVLAIPKTASQKSPAHNWRLFCKKALSQKRRAMSLAVRRPWVQHEQSRYHWKHILINRSNACNISIPKLSSKLVAQSPQTSAPQTPPAPEQQNQSPSAKQIPSTKAEQNTWTWTLLAPQETNEPQITRISFYKPKTAWKMHNNILWDMCYHGALTIFSQQIG